MHGCSPPQPSADARKTPIEQLTDRELDNFRMLGEGLTTGAVANR
jgi:hypothetical protein